ncbi:MAG: HEPN domain-containing protein [Pseudomonadota bacterium]
MITIKSAQTLLDSDPWSAVSRAYYAAFYAVQLYLDEKHEGAGSRIGTHKGVGMKFYELAIVKDGLPRDLAREFEALQDERVNVDYDDEPVPSDAPKIVERSSALVETLLSELQK